MCVWAYCLTSNYVHLVAEPVAEHILALAVGHGYGKSAPWFNSGYKLSGYRGQVAFVHARSTTSTCGRRCDTWNRIQFGRPSGSMDLVR